MMEPKEDSLDDVLADIEDLEQAHGFKEAPEDPSFWRKLGPGLITGIADDDPSGIGTYSIAGAQFGYGLLWLATICIPMVIVVQEMCGRIGAITGEGLAAVLKAHYPRWVLWFTLLLLFVANTINIWADLNVMAASAQMLFHGSFTFWLTAITFLTIALLVVIPYRVYVRYLKWLCLALLGYVVVAFLPALHHDWGKIFQSLLIPHWETSTAYMMAVMGYMGTTISPYCFFWQAGETVEEEITSGAEAEPGHRYLPPSEVEIRTVRTDTAVGMFTSQMIAVFIILCTAGTLHVTGETNLNTAQEAARALLPLGKTAYWLFTFGILGSGLLGIPTLAGSAAYALSETLGWRYGLYRRFKRARGFYITLSAIILLGYLLNFVGSVSPVKGLLYAAILNGVAAPPLILLILMICNNSKIVGERRNRPISNIIGGLTALILAIALILLCRGGLPSGN